MPMNLEEQQFVLQATGGSPALLALTTVDLTHRDGSEEERARIKHALLLAAVPHWCGRDLLAMLLKTTPESSEHMLTRLRVLTVVETFPARGADAINVHEATRGALRLHLRSTDPVLWQQASAVACEYVACNAEPHARIEALYHTFATAPDSAAIECDKLAYEFANVNPEGQYALALVLQELLAEGWLDGAARLQAMLTVLETRGSREERATTESEVRHVLQLALATGSTVAIARAQCLLGDALLSAGNVKDAATAFQAYRSLASQVVSAGVDDLRWRRELGKAHAKIGEVQQREQNYEQAFSSFRASFEVAQELAILEPTSALRQRELSVAYARVERILPMRVVSGDMLAWKSLQSDLVPMVRRILRRHPSLRDPALSNDPDVQSEILTATLMRLSTDDFRTLRRFVELGPGHAPTFESWLYGALDFAVRDHFRQRYGRSRQAVPSKRDLSESASFVPSFEISDAEPADVADKLTVIEILRFVEQTFHPDEVKLMRLYYVEDRSLGEIATELNLPPKQAEQLLRRLNARLRYKFLADTESS